MSKPAELLEQSKSRARQALEAVVGPRAAETILTGGQNISPSAISAAMQQRLRSVLQRFYIPIVLALGTGAVIVTWRSLFTAVETLIEVGAVQA